MFVRFPDQSCNQITQLAHNAGGYVVTSQVSGSQNAPNASLTVRVPAAKFEEIRAQIRKLGLRVESESIEAQDVTKQYVDQEARLRNLRAEEQQYLGILRKAANVKDTLEISEKLNETRGAIEERQAEFEALSKQVETVAIKHHTARRGRCASFRLALAATLPIENCGAGRS
jgi:glycine cleavage system regulatory protein